MAPLNCCWWHSP